MLAARVCFFSFTVDERERAHAAAAVCAQRIDSRGPMLRLLNGFPDRRVSGEFNLASACVSVNLLPAPPPITCSQEIMFQPQQRKAEQTRHLLAP